MSRRSFWPTVLLGVAGSGTAAIAGHQSWVAIHEEAGVASGTSALDRPEVTSIGLALLALWGVLLVTRGRARRAAALLALVGGLALVAFGVHGFVASAHPAFDWFSSSGKPPTTSRNAWGIVAILAAAASAFAAAVALRQAPGWPEMGRKYDAPTGPVAPAVPLEQQEALDVWKAMDEGRDPTADGSE